MLAVILLACTTVLVGIVPKTGACDPPIPGCSTCTTPPGGEQTCTGCATVGQKVQPNGKGCIAKCPDNTNEAGGICTCTETYQPSKDGQTCVLKTACNTPNCKACDNPKTDREVCTECNDKSYLTPTNQCISDCTTISGYYGDTDKKCKACSPECAECVGPANNQCSACPAGKALTYGGSDPAQGGTCGDACTADKNGCKVCGARIGGTDYCSQCSETQVPIDGVCVQNTGNRAALCTAKGDGTCASCVGGDLLKDGGCYKTDRLPGKSVCTTASNSKCTKCANGLNADGDGACGNCHPTCATCSTAEDPNKCKTCATGYYKTSNSDGPCKKYSERLAGCRQCTVSSTGAFMCLEMGDGTGDNTGGSTNKSGLSTGAIAGISVAVIVVVGGLVGFLCWWFLCRGKA